MEDMPATMLVPGQWQRLDRMTDADMAAEKSWLLNKWREVKDDFSGVWKPFDADYVSTRLADIEREEAKRNARGAQ